MTRTTGEALVGDISIGMSARDATRLSAATLRPGTTINIGHLGTETSAQRLAAMRHVSAAGFRPVPHVSARRVPSRLALESYLGQLEALDASAHVFVVGGDPARQLGPFGSALDVLRSGALERHGVRVVSIAGYAEGHPAVSTRTLWHALEHKVRLLRDESRAGDIISQLSLDPTAVVTWIAEVRDRGIDLPIRIGIPGPVDGATLLRHARHYAAYVDARLLRDIGIDEQLPRAIVTADRLVAALAERLDPRLHGRVGLHVFGFGDVSTTTDWVGRLTDGCRAAADRTEARLRF